MVPKKRARRLIGHPGKPSSKTLAPTTLGRPISKARYYYPLTISDGYSRFLLCCQALTSTAVDEAKPEFTHIFKEYGLPKVIRTDNGVPCATDTLGRRLAPLLWAD